MVQVSAPQTSLFTSLRWDPRLVHAEFNTKLNGGSPSEFLMLPYHVDRLKSATRDAAGDPQNKEDDLGKGSDWAGAVLKVQEDSFQSEVESFCQKAVEEYGKTIEAEDKGDDWKNTGLLLRIVLARTGKVHIETYFPGRPLLDDGLSPLRYFESPATSPSPVPSASSALPQPVLSVYLDSESTPHTFYTEHKTTRRAHYDAARGRIGLGADRTVPKEVILWNENGEIMEGSARNVAFWRSWNADDQADSKNTPLYGWVSPSNSSGGLTGTMRRWMIENGYMRTAVVHKDSIKADEWVLLSNGVDVSILGKITTL